MAKRRGDSALLRRFGERLRRLRKDAGLTQQELAGRAGLDWKYLGAVERAERNPSLDVMAQLARALGIELSQLFYFTDAGVVSADRVAERRVLFALAQASPDDKLALRQIVDQLLAWRTPPAATPRRTTPRRRS